jgi:uncharacterized protein (TIGR02145 family)
MKKILLGIIVVGLSTLVGCEKEDDSDTETTDSTETTSDDSLIEYGEGATDIDGNIYTSVIIGDQEWMVENLRTTNYSDGTPIPNDTVIDTLSYSGACFNYEHDSKYESTYGKLYNWYAVETGKLAPKGWHVPTDSEWKVLTDYLAANGHTGTALKSKSGWNDNWWDGTSGNGTDDYGWNGLPGGYLDHEGNFRTIGNDGFWWSSSHDFPSAARSFNLHLLDDVYRSPNDSKRNGFSVRCLRD